MSNMKLFNQISYMGNAMKNMASCLKEIQREMYYTLGARQSNDNHYLSVGEMYQFGYDARSQPVHSRDNQCPHILLHWNIRVRCS